MPPFFYLIKSNKFELLGIWKVVEIFFFDRDFAKFRITISKYFKIGRAQTEIQGRKEPKAQAAAIGGRPPFCRAGAAGPPVSKELYPNPDKPERIATKSQRHKQ